MLILFEKRILRKLYLYKTKKIMFIIFFKNFFIFFTQTSNLIIITFLIFININEFIREIINIMIMIIKIKNIY